MRKFVIVLLAASMLLAMAGCGVDVNIPGSTAVADDLPKAAESVADANMATAEATMWSEN